MLPAGSHHQKIASDKQTLTLLAVFIPVQGKKVEERADLISGNDDGSLWKESVLSATRLTCRGESSSNRLHSSQGGELEQEPTPNLCC